MKEIDRWPMSEQPPDNDEPNKLFEHITPLESPKPLGKMLRSKVEQFDMVPGTHMEDNENMAPYVGDWVSIKNKKDAAMIRKSLQSNPPYVTARVRGQFAYVVSRKNYREGMHLAVDPLEIGVRDVPSWGVSLDNLKISFKHKILKG